ncbi:engulfment and cell motility ELM family protein [Tieghemostelium lacteum]|uniref:Engulfment and cell motility ELM family protein n=1 Tax=Tieghemostelium lacteum TaxID=361077 RepID=A0A151ZGZ2_TIELA|nr:engulfment and cell motility ELM family protein [Tieghemostelium lacteum]|eukprot:KYQ93236.1 engulfment and cell motility ELM family protein [Tieghemostelium lacteum]
MSTTAKGPSKTVPTQEDQKTAFDDLFLIPLSFDNKIISNTNLVISKYFSDKNNPKLEAVDFPHIRVFLGVFHQVYEAPTIGKAMGYSSSQSNSFLLPFLKQTTSQFNKINNPKIMSFLKLAVTYITLNNLISVDQSNSNSTPEATTSTSTTTTTTTTTSSSTTPTFATPTNTSNPLTKFSLMPLCYFISEVPPSGMVKLGETKNIENRITKLQTGNPRVLKLEYVIPSTLELKKPLENKLKDLFNDRKHRGEWYKFDDINEIPSLISAAGFIETPIRFN